MHNSKCPSASTSNQPIVSVLMPCFNHQNLVTSALDSIAESTYASLELVFIDDASSDNSFINAQDWLELNHKRFLRVICERHESNRGISATLNELVSKATGQYLTILASDDLLIPDGIKKQVQFANEKNVSYIFADAKLIDEDGGLISPSALVWHGRSPKYMTNRICLLVDVLLNWEMPWSRIFIRTDHMKRLGMFDESLRFEDRDFVVRALLAGSFAFMPDPVYVYRMRRNNRLTPGLDADGMRIDFQRSEAKNYRAASGIAMLLLGLNVLAGKIRFDRYGNPISSLIWPFFALIRRVVKWAHLVAMR